MPSKKGFDQSVTWLKSKMAERDTLDAINAEVCYNVLIDLKKRKDIIGAKYHQTVVQRNEALDELYNSALRAMNGYSEDHKGG